MLAGLLLFVALTASLSCHASAVSSSTGASSSSVCTAWNYTMVHNTSMPESVVLANAADLPPSDDAVAEFSFPFNFTFYGSQYTSVEVSTNGNIQFVSTSIAWVDSLFPINLSTPAQQVPIIAMYYVDLNPDLDWMQQTAVIGQPPSRQAIIRYNAVPVCPFDQNATHNDTANDTSVIDAQPSVTCDVVLYEIDSHIDIRYFDIDPTPWPVDVGVQGSGPNDWTAAVDHAPLDTSVVQWLANSTITFVPVCLQWETVTPVGGGTAPSSGSSSSAPSTATTTVSSSATAMTGGTMSTAATASTATVMASSSSTASPSGTGLQIGSPTNGAKSISGSVSLAVAAVASLLVLL